MLERFGFRDELEEDLLERARNLRPLLESQSARCEAERKMTPAAVEALEKAGLWSLTLPRRHGGLGVSSTTMARVWVELGKGCTATAWSHFILSMGSWMATTLPSPLREEMFADGAPRVCGGVNPSGSARPVSGGYILNGAWPYNSGCHYAQWAIFGTFIEDPDGGRTEGVVAFVPMTDVKIEENWNVAGMRGTGSHTGVAEDVFVPAHRLLNSAAMRSDFSHRIMEEPCDFFPGMQLQRAAILGVLVGAAEAMIERISAAALTRPVAYTIYKRQADSPVIHRELGEAVAKIQAAKVLMEHLTQLMDRDAIERREASDRERADNRACVSLAVNLVSEVVDQLMFIGGSSAFNDANDLQRYWRDVNMAARHANLIPNFGYEMCGRARLGVEPNIVPSYWI